jgi:DNA-binding winged helix-turn-helix (wHTH) protein/cytochrome c-type biogenesis protein CcmH/NrfG
MGNKHLYAFGAFKLDPQQKILLRENVRVPLFHKTYETLLALLEANGEVMSKDDLIAKVWPDSFVDESSLTKNISILRKAFKNGENHSNYIETISGVGYRFIGSVQQAVNGDGYTDSQENNLTTELPIQSQPMTDVAQIIPEVEKPVIVPVPRKITNQNWWLFAAVALLIIGAVAIIYPQRKKSESGVEAAQRLYATGRYFWNQRTIEGFRKGLTCFEQATELDPHYAPAWAGIGDSWSLLTEYDFLPANEGYPKAKIAVLRALELDPKLAEAHATLATIKAYYEWDWQGAENSFQQAVALQPDYATAHQWYAEFLAGQDRPQEALQEIQRAHELDPGSRIIQSTVARVLDMAHDYDGIIAKCHEVLTHDPNFAEVYSYLGAAYEQKQMFQEAMDAFEKRSVMMGDNTPTASALRTSVIQNKQDYWEKRLKVEEVKLYGSPFDKAEALAQLGETEQALDLLEQSCEKGRAGVAYLKINRSFDSLRNQPRFIALLRHVKLIS